MHSIYINIIIIDAELYNRVLSVSIAKAMKERPF